MDPLRLLINDRMKRIKLHETVKDNFYSWSLQKEFEEKTRFDLQLYIALCDMVRIQIVEDGLAKMPMSVELIPF